ncbi:MAG: non-homologous end-joining DNA ligase, partial [Gammaproteobacteria bacterium]
RFKNRTADGLLRQPAFMRYRDDKQPLDCLLPEAGESLPEPAPVKEQRERDVRLTNLEKVFWPEEGYTKGDLVTYYQQVAEWLLPYLRDRPLVLTRYPDGIDGKSFFQKDAPAYAPDWLRLEAMWSEHAEREIRYFIVEDIEALTYVANMGAIPLHIWSSRVSQLQHPDWCILDLDPKGAPFTDVIAIARGLRRLCEAIGLPNYVKTSGSSGLHVLVPLGARYSYEQSRTLAELLARCIVKEMPQLATIRRAIDAREGKVYIDFLQNGHGRLLVAPFSVRPLAAAPVSMPLGWGQVNRRLTMTRFTIKTAVPLLAKGKADPLLGVMDDAPDLAAALERLSERL